MSINQTVDLNLSASVMPPVLNMAQYDANSRMIVATLWDGASGFTIPAGAVVMVRFGKPDGTGGLYDKTEAGTAITYSGNVVTAPVATQMLSVAGTVQADIEIYQTGASEQAAVKLATFCFVVNVEKAAYQDADIISSDYYNVLAAQIAAAIEAGAKADAAIQAAQTATEAATTATNAKTAAENAKASAESAETTAVNAKTAAESAKTAAQTAKTAAESAKTAAAGSATAAAGSASSAEEDAQSAAQDAEDAEAWAVGKRNGVDVGSSDPAYRNNAKYYKDQAQVIAGGGVTSFNGRGGAVIPEVGDYTKDMVGLGSVDNTSDADKPVSTKQQAALNDKQAKITAGGILKGNGDGAVEAATPRVDYAAASTIVTATLLSSGWTGTSAPFVYELSVSGVTASSNQEVLPPTTVTADQLTAIQSANIVDGGQETGKIILKAFGDKPTIDLPIRIILRGDM